MRRGSPRIVVINSLLLICSLFIALLIAEAAVRALDVPPRPMDPLPIPSYQLSDDSIIDYEYRPNYSPSDEPNDWAMKNFSINSAGFRDREYTDTKPEGVYRVVVLGNSITAGHGIPHLDSIYPKQLEKLLNESAASRQGDNGPLSYEVLNLAVGGYQPMQSAQTLKVKGLKYDPDMVLLALGVNDFSLYMSEPGYWLRKKNGTDLYNDDWFSQLSKKSRLAFWVRSILVKHSIINHSFDEYIQWYNDNILQGETTVRAAFSLISELKKRQGFSACVVIIPEFSNQFHQYESKKFHEKVFDAAKDLTDLTVIDLLEDFSKVSDDAEIFAYDGLHLNEYGHKVLAKILLSVATSESGGPDNRRKCGIDGFRHARVPTALSGGAEVNRHE